MTTSLVLIVFIATGAFSASSSFGDFTSPLADLYDIGAAPKAVATQSSMVEHKVVEAIPQRRTEKLVLRQETRADWKNPLEDLVQKTASEWNLKDAALEQMLKFALMNEESFIADIVAQRQQSFDTWKQWLASENKIEPRNILAKVVEKKIKKIPGNSEVLAKWMIDADITGKSQEFSAEMLKNITTLPDYHFLLLSVFGYPQFLIDAYHEAQARRMNGVELSDIETLRRCFALLLVAYRAEYDAQYPAAFESYALIPFMSEFSLDNKAMDSFQVAEYLKTPLAKDAVHQERWRALVALARGQAHAQATRVVKQALEQLRTIFILFQARLESLRISNESFQFPSAAAPSKEVLSQGQAQSFLLGCVFRAAERMLISKENLLFTDVVLGIVLQEYRDQISFNRIVNLPAGESGGQDVLRSSFEARIGLLLGSIDFSHPVSLKSAVLSALGDYTIDKAVALYKKATLISAYINGIAWGIAPKKTELYKAYTQSLQLVRGYLETLKLKIGTTADLTNTYKELIMQCVGKTTKQFSSKARIDLGRCSAEQIQAFYKLHWLFFGARLLRRYTTLQSGDQDALSGDESGALSTDQIPAALVDREEVGLSPAQLAIKKAQENVNQFGQRMGNRAATITHELKHGTQTTISSNLTDALSDTGDFINSLQSMIAVMYKQSDQMYSRMHATFKALTLYTHYLNEYANRKIENYKKIVDDTFNGITAKIGLPIVRHFLEKAARDARITANQDDDRLLRKVNLAMQDLKLALSGKKTLKDLPDIPATAASSFESAYDIAAPAA